MAGKVWYWSRKRREASAFSLQAWRDGVPAASDAVIVIDDCPLPPAWRAAGEPFVLNAEASAFAQLKPAEMKRRLARSGVRIEDTAGSAGSRNFAVSVFHLQPIEVQRVMPAAASHSFSRSGASAAWAAEGAAESRQQLDPADPLYIRLTRLALKALHALGLELAVVSIHTEGSGRCTVKAVELPEIAALGGTVWDKAIQKFAADWQTGQFALPGRENKDKEQLIGADPEFLLLSKQGKVVSAARYLEGGHGTGCDAVVVGGRVMYPVAELRPAPASTPVRLAHHIHQLLLQANMRISDQTLRWAAGGMPAPGFALGGHIHLSGVKLTSRLLHQLDSYLALPLAMIESANEQLRRPRFGSLGDFRFQPHGGFEYRTLPSWLVSPLAAKGAFALMLLCARETDQLLYLPSREERIIDAYYSGDRIQLRGCLEPLIAAMKATRSYEELSRWIEPLMNAALQGRIWDTQADIRLKWRIPAKE
ncbi:hypothetical protein ACFPYJ_04565 [Paenibacillus solisilvae]|uniref:Phage phiEco32-like COOH-NH2 ligase-type 2 n=1 Tax=Paenibacillus solisilvae TaxID=2486751 RepID=A0ABW0VRB2_9BACL